MYKCKYGQLHIKKCNTEVQSKYHMLCVRENNEHFLWVILQDGNGQTLENHIFWWNNNIWRGFYGDGRKDEEI